MTYKQKLINESMEVCMRARSYAHTFDAREKMSPAVWERVCVVLAARPDTAGEYTSWTVPGVLGAATIYPDGATGVILYTPDEYEFWHGYMGVV